MNIRIFSPEKFSKPDIPYAASPISAGFPSPADDYLENGLDLNKALITNPSATFFARVSGFSMKDAGIDHEDLLVIDKSLPYKKGALAVCFINGEFTLKRIKFSRDQILLMPANPDYEPIAVTADADFKIWGIVTYVIKKVF